MPNNALLLLLLLLLLLRTQHQKSAMQAHCYQCRSMLCWSQLTKQLDTRRRQALVI